MTARPKKYILKRSITKLCFVIFTVVNFFEKIYRQNRKMCYLRTQKIYCRSPSVSWNILRIFHDVSRQICIYFAKHNRIAPLLWVKAPCIIRSYSPIFNGMISYDKIFWLIGKRVKKYFSLIVEDVLMIVRHIIIKILGVIQPPLIDTFRLKNALLQCFNYETVLKNPGETWNLLKKQVLRLKLQF